MKFVINNPEKITKFIELFTVLKKLNDYCIFICRVDELYVQTLDMNQICLCDLKISNDWFELYEGNDDIISFDTSIVSKILSLYNKTNTKDLIFKSIKYD
jgi:DNA polymerase III sliding clamp (beta) subunit (PCNA family)